MVVALHLGGVPLIGAYAVFGFYCLSGYLMTLIMQTKYGYTYSGITKYGINRFLRIYPIYWVSALLSIALIWCTSNEITSNYHSSIYLPTGFSEFARNLMLFFPFSESPRLTPPAWALTVEIFFYFLIGMGISKTKLISLIWFGLSITYHLSTFLFQLNWDIFSTIIAASLPFSTGALIFHFKNEVNVTRYFNSLLFGKHKYLPYFLALAILINWAIGYMLSQSIGLFFYTNYILCAFMVVVLADIKDLPFISRRFDNWMGDFSYPIYLFHYQIGFILIVLFAKFGISLKRPDLILMSASLPVLFLFSWIITVSLEKPIEIIRSKIKR